MPPNKFKLTIHLASSLDGIIAKKDNSVDWFETPDYYDKGIEITKEEMFEFNKTVDCFIMGANTYEHALELSKTYGWPYEDKPTIVVSHRNLPIRKPNIQIFSGDLNKLVNEELKSKYTNAWLVGGAILAKEFIKLKLVDEIRLTILPIMLGDGLLFFENIGQEQLLHLKDVKAYKTGIVELCYEMKNPSTPSS